MKQLGAAWKMKKKNTPIDNKVNIRWGQINLFQQIDQSECALAIERMISNASFWLFATNERASLFRWHSMEG